MEVKLAKKKDAQLKKELKNLTKFHQTDILKHIPKEFRITNKQYREANKIRNYPVTQLTDKQRKLLDKADKYNKFCNVMNMLFDGKSFLEP